MNPAPPVISSVPTTKSNCGTRRERRANVSLRAQRALRLNGSSFGVHERQPQLFRERVDGRAAAFPGTFGFEPQVADAAAPRRDDAADGTEVAAIGVLLIEPANHIGRDPNERAERRGAANAVLAAVPGAAEDERNLLEVVDEELFRLFVHVGRFAAEDAVGREQLLQFLRERCLRDAAASNAEQLDFVVERRVFAVVQRADDVVRRRERVVAIQLAAREADEVRRIEARVLRVDRHEHLHDVIFGKPIEDDRRNAEVLVPEALDVGVQRQQPVLAVDGAQDAFALRHLQDADAVVAGRLEGQLLVARDDDGAGNRRQIARLTALLVVLHQLVDLLPDDLALVGLVARRNAALEEVPVHLRRLRQTGFLSATPHVRLSTLAVAEKLEPDELIYVAGREGSLVELHPELLHSNRGNIDHRLSPSRL